MIMMEVKALSDFPERQQMLLMDARAAVETAGNRQQGRRMRGWRANLRS